MLMQMGYTNVNQWWRAFVDDGTQNTKRCLLENSIKRTTLIVDVRSTGEFYGALTPEPNILGRIAQQNKRIG